MDNQSRIQKIKEMNIDDFLNALFDFVYNKKNDEEKTQKIYQCIFNTKEVDYIGLYTLLPKLDFDDISLILKYDKDYKISFLLSLVDIADEEDLTKQAIFLLRRHNLSYIINKELFKNQM